MCILIEGCTAPLSLAGRPAGVSEEDWTQWGRHLKRLCLDGSPQARFSAVLRAKLGGLRVAHATSWECLDKKRGPLLLPLAPRPAPNPPPGGAEAPPVAPEVAERTRLYREKLLLHAWIDCFLSGMKLALIGQCDCEVPPPPESDTAAAKADGGDAEDGGAATVAGGGAAEAADSSGAAAAPTPAQPSAKFVKIRPTEPREMYRTARDNQLWDWNNTVHFGAAALRWLHECAAGKATRNALWPGFLIWQQLTRLRGAHRMARSRPKAASTFCATGRPSASSNC